MNMGIRTSLAIAAIFLASMALATGLTDDENDIRQIAAFAAGLRNVERVDVLPFHQLGRHKWEKLAIDYRLNEVEPPAQELVERVCGHFRAAGLQAY